MGWGFRMGGGLGQRYIERRVHIPHLFYVYAREKVKG